MKVNTYLFTQTLSSLLSSSLSLQESLLVCSKVLSSKNDKKFSLQVLEDVKTGMKFFNSLEKFKNNFSPLYIALAFIGQETGTLKNVFEKLSIYLKTQKKLKEKFLLSLSYPVLILITTIFVIAFIFIFVSPRFSDILLAFTESSNEVTLQMIKIKSTIIFSLLIFFILVLVICGCAFFCKTSEKFSYAFDCILLKVPVVRNVAIAMQMREFSFAMKILLENHFTFLESFRFGESVVKNKRIRKSISKVKEGVSNGEHVGEVFEREKIFPEYFVSWVKIAEENGNIFQSFSQIYEYYENETKNILECFSNFLEPCFTLLTGIILIFVIGQFVVPLFNLLGAL